MDRQTILDEIGEKSEPIFLAFFNPLDTSLHATMHGPLVFTDSVKEAMQIHEANAMGDWNPATLYMAIRPLSHQVYGYYPRSVTTQVEAWIQEYHGIQFHEIQMEFEKVDTAKEVTLSLIVQLSPFELPTGIHFTSLAVIEKEPVYVWSNRYIKLLLQRCMFHGMVSKAHGVNSAILNLAHTIWED